MNQEARVARLRELAAAFGSTDAGATYGQNLDARACREVADDLEAAADALVQLQKDAAEDRKVIIEFLTEKKQLQATVDRLTAALRQAATLADDVQDMAQVFITTRDVTSLRNMAGNVANVLRAALAPADPIAL